MIKFKSPYSLVHFVARHSVPVSALGRLFFVSTFLFSLFCIYLISADFISLNNNKFVSNCVEKDIKKRFQWEVEAKLPILPRGGINYAPEGKTHFLYESVSRRPFSVTHKKVLFYYTSLFAPTSSLRDSSVMAMNT